MKQKEWNIPLSGPSVSQELLEGGFSPLLSQILALRGFTTAAQAKAGVHHGRTGKDPALRREGDPA